MLRAIVGWSLRYRGIVVALAAILVAYGSYVAARSRLDVFPEFAPPQVVVQTEAPGLPPTDVELLVTRPIEAAVNGVPGLVALRSESIQGFSVTIATFRDDVEILEARQLVAQRLAELAGRLPDGVETPLLAPLTSSTSLVLAVGLTSTTRTPMELRDFAAWTLRPRLLGVPGVASVVEFGGEERQLQIRLRPERMLAHDLPLEAVLDAAREATGVRGAGFIDTGNQRIGVRTEGQALDAPALGAVVVGEAEGSPLRLRDVADVAEGAAPKIGDAAIMEQPGVLLLVWGQYGSNTLEVTDSVERALDELRPATAAADITMRTDLFRPADFIERALGNIRWSLLLGGALVAAVLFLFLLDLRTALVSFVSIPISLLAAVVVLDRFGVPLNTMTLGGFAIAIGVVVDDAIIDVENILRRLRLNQEAGGRRALGEVILDASLEVRSAIVYATFIVALVFLPVLTLSGVQGRLFAPVAVAFLLATGASLVVALTVTPALCRLLLARGPAATESPFVRRLKRAHLALLDPAMRHPGRLLAVVLVLTGLAGLALPLLGSELLPEFLEGHYVVWMRALPGTSTEESMRIGREVSRELLVEPHVHTVSLQVGRAEAGEDTVGPEFSEFVVGASPRAGEDAGDVERGLRAVLADFPAMSFGVQTFLAERMQEVISGETAQVVVHVFGDDLPAIDAAAADVAGALRGVRGAADVDLRSPPTEPQLLVTLRPEELARYGFRPVQVLSAVQTAVAGLPVAQVFAGNRVVDVVVRVGDFAHHDPERLTELRLRNGRGESLPLGALADVAMTDGRHAVLHDGTRRTQVVGCNVVGRDLDDFDRDVRATVAALRLPPGVYVSFSGEAEEGERARRELAVHVALAAAGIVTLLALVFRRARTLLLVLANVPFALVGGVLAALASGGILSIGSLVGFVALFGISARNSIMLVSHYEHLTRVEGLEWTPQVALRGASERLVPILMTALVTAGGLLPLAWESRTPGREIEGPMAVVILGGLLTSTVLNLLLLPALAARFGAFETQRSVNMGTREHGPDAA